MTNWYYTDPLAAPWMAKYFGLSLVCSDDFGERAPLTCDWLERSMSFDTETWADLTREPSRRIFIHPDSLHLLGPRVGDLVLFDYAGRTRHSFVVAPQDQGPGRLRLEGSIAIDASDARIVQRDGMPFMSPQGEAP